MRLYKWMSNDHDLINFLEDGNLAKQLEGGSWISYSHQGVRSRDSRVRACRLKLSGGAQVEQPIQLLYLLEVNGQ
ncbi:hypothetical protein MRX96_023623 [Rhipicephalus microplus]